MGEVFLAEHRNIDRFAAIKLLLPEMSSNEEIVARFFNEARAASRIKHPGIVEILDCDMHASGRAYIVMEFLEGESLGDCLKRVGRLDQAAALDVLDQIARALEAAHAKAIIHRDLKPDNVFLASTGDGQPPVVKVLDFGIAKLAAEGDGQQKTKTGNLLGTPLYMSPEQCRGAGKIDNRSDVYSLGCIAYELLTGRPPFVREGAGELLVAHILETPARVSSHVPGVAPEIDALIAAMLEKEPAQRPGSMSEVAAKIEAVTGFARPGVPVGSTTGRQSPADVSASRPGTRPLPTPLTTSGAGTRPLAAPVSTTASETRPLPTPVTTLGRSAGEVMGADEIPRSSKRGLLIGAGVAAAVIVVGVVALRGSGGHDEAKGPLAAAAPASPPAAPAAPSAAAPSAPAPKADIKFEIASTPAGAEVWVGEEKAARGRTPLTVALPPGAPAAAVLKSAGFADKRVALDPRGQTKLSVALDPMAQEKDKAKAKVKETDLQPDKQADKQKGHAHRAKTEGGGSLYRPMGD
jgi:serine/threonine-protein kinase